ncbi:MAG: 2Fe-2S iron-sulfur cluster-binding protein, partial [Ardenticatenaceae bacterium]
SARIALGSVAPTIVRAPEAEALLARAPLTDETIEEAARLTTKAASPIDDVRGTADYRARVLRVITRRLLEALRDGRERDLYPTRRANLWQRAGHPVSVAPAPASTIMALVNGAATMMEGAQGKTLLRALRENAHLVGTKEGCAEGECGACTVWLDGAAVMSCLVPAERAHGAAITTIEGLAHGDDLHPVQQAFIEYDALQCGYCTPGFIMSAAKLLEEKGGDFTDEELRQAISGNLCRCTGYYKIIEAIRAAGATASKSPAPS